jgi:hypothetical protein
MPAFSRKILQIASFAGGDKGVIGEFFAADIDFIRVSGDSSFCINTIAPNDFA